MTVIRLVELCDVLDIRPTDFRSRVNDILPRPTDPQTITVDLVKIMRTDDPNLNPARVWAGTQLVNGKASLARIPRAAITSLAMVCQVAPEYLTDIVSADLSARDTEVNANQPPKEKAHRGNHGRSSPTPGTTSDPSAP